MTANELVALTSASHDAFRAMSLADIHRMLTEQNADVRSTLVAAAH